MRKSRRPSSTWWVRPSNPCRTTTKKALRRLFCCSAGLVSRHAGRLKQLDGTRSGRGLPWISHPFRPELVERRAQGSAGRVFQACPRQIRSWFDRLTTNASGGTRGDVAGTPRGSPAARRDSASAAIHWARVRHGLDVVRCRCDFNSDVPMHPARRPPQAALHFAAAAPAARHAQAREAQIDQRGRFRYGLQHQFENVWKYAGCALLDPDRIVAGA